MAWYNPATWSVIDNLQGQNKTSQTSNAKYPTSLYYNANNDVVEQQQTDGSWSPLSGQVNGSTSNTPNMPTSQAPSQAAAKPVLNRAAIVNTQKALDELPGILQRALDADRQTYENAKRGFDTQEAQQQAQYNEGTTTNQLNYDANLMASLRSGASGLGGLLSILRGTGAEGWARDAVMNTTNTDIRGGLDTREQNQGQLDSSLSGFLTELEGKRNANDQTLRNNEYAARGANATQAQKLYSDMASIYADAEDTGNATRFMNKAGDYSADIARYGTAPVSRFDTNPVAVKAAEVSAFADPTKQNVAVTDSNQGGGAGIFTIGDTRRKLAGIGA